MTTHAMSCEDFNDRLMAYLEHETDDDTRAAIERHSISCGDCGALLADLRKLRIESANLPLLTPSRDLWSGIAARIEAPVVPIGTVRHLESGRGTTTRRILRGALIAASLVGAAGIGYLAAVRRTPDIRVSRPVAQAPLTLRPEVVEPAIASPTGSNGSAQVARLEPAASEAARGSQRSLASREAPAGVRTVANTASAREGEAQTAVRTLTADYDREISRLRVLIDQRRNQMDPVTVAIIEKNLQVIDSAIAECKKAIGRDPASRFLIESLNQSLQTKVELMRTAALLPSRT